LKVPKSAENYKQGQKFVAVMKAKNRGTATSQMRKIAALSRQKS
jgi:hypothetical protein